LCAHGSHCPRFSLHPTSEQWLAVKTSPATTIYLRVGKVVNNNVAICSGHNHERVAHTHGIAPLWQLLCMSWVLLPCVPIPALLQTTVLSARNIFHKNREISILRIKKKTARLTLLQEATERTNQGETQKTTVLSARNRTATKVSPVVIHSQIMH
jgi:hypothetical protein